MTNKKTLLCFFSITIGILMILINHGLAQENKPRVILSIEAYDMLNTVPDTYLIDVRTRAEYQFVGHPINAYLFPYQFMTSEFGKNEDVYCYRYSVKNKAFIQEILKLFKKTDNLLIIGRDGKRSALAAAELVQSGFKNVYNVEDGFEGPKFPSFDISLILQDSDKHKYYRQLAKRNKIQGFDQRRHYGWQWWGLPWTYEIDPKYIYPPDLNPPKK